MQGVHLIDSSLAHVSCDLCCVQVSALAMPACKWASSVHEVRVVQVSMHGQRGQKRLDGADAAPECR